MTAEQIRAARALLRWDQADISKAADVSVETIKRLEAMDGELLEVRAATVAAIQKAFEKAGVEFLNHGQPGARLTKPVAKRR